MNRYLKMSVVLIIFFSLAGCSLPLEKENPREVFEFYKDRSFTVEVNYDQVNPVLYWEEVKGWDNKPAEKYDIELYNVYSGEPVRVVDVKTATFYVVSCEKNYAYRVYAYVKDGVVRSEIVTLKKCKLQ